MPLTFRESQDLRQRLDNAISDVVGAFIARSVVKTPAGVPIHGPDPRSVSAETVLHLARYLMRQDMDLVDAAAFEDKIARLEAELTGAYAAAGEAITTTMLSP